MPGPNPIAPVLELLPMARRATAWIITQSEQSLSHTKFAQDTLIAWGIRQIFSRTKVESKEIHWEFPESILIYYGVTGVSQMLQHPFYALAQKFSKDPAFSKNLITTAIEDIPKGVLGKVLPVKAAIVLASIGVTAIGGEYAMNFLRNLVTEKCFKVSLFTDMVGLSNNKVQEGQLSPNGQKAVNCIRHCLEIAAGCLVGGGLLAAFGGRFSKTLEPLLAKVLNKRFDFDYSDAGHFKLSRPLMYAFMAIGVTSYIHAAKDYYDRIETATRLAVIIPSIAILKELIQKKMSGQYLKDYPSLF